MSSIPWTPILAIVGMFAGTFLLGSLANVIGAATGQNPMAQMASTMMQTMMPLFVTMLPMAIVMNLMVSIINTMMAPIQMVTRLVPSPAPTIPIH